jgi:hypothetical protein
MAEPKLLFLLSSDYGELSNALHFLRGTGLDATLLLPVRLFDANRDTLQVRSRPYATLGDVVEALARERPDVVFLFSAYLYAINGILALDAVEALLTELERRHVCVVTSDPFLGLLRADGGSLFSEQHPQRQWLQDHFGRLAARVRDLPSQATRDHSSHRPQGAGIERWQLGTRESPVSLPGAQPCEVQQKGGIRSMAGFALNATVLEQNGQTLYLFPLKSDVLRRISYVVPRSDMNPTEIQRLISKPRAMEIGEYIKEAVDNVLGSRLRSRTGRRGRCGWTKQFGRKCQRRWCGRRHCNNSGGAPERGRDDHGKRRSRR